MDTNSVDIYYCQFSKNVEHFEILFELLDQEEKERALRFYFEKDKISFTIARAFLKLIISKYQKVNPKDIKFTYNQYGKSYLDGSNLYYNLSHSKDFSLYGFSYLGELGIDIEFMKEKIDFKNIIKRFFSENEIKDFLTLPDFLQREAFFNGWSRKEAYIKAVGRGLNIPLDSFDVELRPNQEVKIKDIREEPEKRDWFLYNLEINENYKSALVTSFICNSFRLKEVRYCDFKVF